MKRVLLLVVFMLIVSLLPYTDVSGEQNGFDVSEINRILSENGCNVGWLLENYGGMYGLPEQCYTDYSAEGDPEDPNYDAYWGFINAVWNAGWLSDSVYSSYNTEEINTASGSASLTFSYNGLVRVLGSFGGLDQDWIDETVVSYFQELDAQSHSNSGNSSGNSVIEIPEHHFEIVTNSYKGTQFKIIGRNTAKPVIYKKNGSDWVALD